MLAGLPIVSTDVGGIPELINAAGSGEIVPPESPTALAERINSAANAGRQALALVGNKGEQFVRDHMDVRETAAQLEPLYMEAIDRHHRRFVVNGTDALPRSMPRSA
jgi:glycosyltransferase involved in cell wall biosynthesis